jgi:hypothetical protein
MAAQDYTEQERDEALAIYRELGAAEAARRTGISRPTISSWASRRNVHRNGHEPVPPEEPPAEPREPKPWPERRRELAADLDRLAEDLLGRIRGTRHAPAAKAYMVTMGVLLDKLEMLNASAAGEPVRGDRIDDEIDRLVDELVAQGEERRARRAVTEPPDGLAADLRALTPAGEDAAKPAPSADHAAHTTRVARKLDAVAERRAQRAEREQQVAPAVEPQDPPLPPKSEQQVARPRAELENVEAELERLAARQEIRPFEGPPLCRPTTSSRRS